MNKVILMGRLTREPEIRYSQSAEPVAVARYSLAINRRYKRDGEPDADFINCVAFGKTGEFAERFFKKGMMVAVSGRLQVRSWDDQQTGQKRWSTEVVVEEQEFGESKASFESRAQSDNFDQGLDYTKQTTNNAQPSQPNSFGKEPEGFSSIAENVDDDDLPF